METETQPLWVTTREAMGKHYTIGLWQEFPWPDRDE